MVLRPFSFEQFGDVLEGTGLDGGCSFDLFHELAPSEGLVLPLLRDDGTLAHP